MSDRIIRVKDVDLNAMTTMSTDKIHVVKADFAITSDHLKRIEMEVKVNVRGIPKSAREYHRFCSTRKITVSTVGHGRITCQVDPFISFPFRAVQKAEYEAMEEFSVKLREFLGWEKDPPLAENEEPPDELAVTKEELREAQFHAQQLQRRVDELTQKFAEAADMMKASADKLKP